LGKRQSAVLQLTLRRTRSEPLGVNHGEPFEDSNFAKRLVSDDEVVHQILLREIERDRQLQGVERAQSRRETVLTDEPLRSREVIVGDSEDFISPAAISATGGRVGCLRPRGREPRSTFIANADYIPPRSQRS